MNILMRKRRRALGWTQFDLAQLSGVCISDIQAMERFRYLSGKLRIVNHRLIRVAQTLELDFDKLFPSKYLHALQQMKYPRASGTFRWMREIHLAELTTGDLPADLIDHSAEQVEHHVDQWALRQILEELLNDLSPRERLVMEKRFGLDDGDAQTFEEVGRHFGVSRERIRQIETHALRRLRHPVRSRRLKPFLGLL